MKTTHIKKYKVKSTRNEKHLASGNDVTFVLKLEDGEPVYEIKVG